MLIDWNHELMDFVRQWLLLVLMCRLRITAPGGAEGIA